MSEDKNLEQLKEELRVSGQNLISLGQALSVKANLLDLQTKLDNFNRFMAGVNIKHNHDIAIVSIIKRNVLKKKKLPETANVASLESYLAHLTAHITLYNNYIDLRIANRHTGVFKYDKDIIIRQYQARLTNSEQAKDSFNIIDEAKKQKILEKKDGKPEIFKIFITAQNKKTKQTEIIKVITNEDLQFTNYSVTTEFTNNVKHVQDFYSNGIYAKNNASSPDGRLGKSEIFNAVIASVDSPDFEILEDDIQPQPTNDKEKENDKDK